MLDNAIVTFTNAFALRDGPAVTWTWILKRSRRTHIRALWLSFLGSVNTQRGAQTQHIQLERNSRMIVGACVFPTTTHYHSRVLRPLRWRKLPRVMSLEKSRATVSLKSERRAIVTSAREWRGRAARYAEQAAVARRGVGVMAASVDPASFIRKIKRSAPVCAYVWCGRFSFSVRCGPAGRTLRESHDRRTAVPAGQGFFASFGATKGRLFGTHSCYALAAGIATAGRGAGTPDATVAMAAASWRAQQGEALLRENISPAGDATTWTRQAAIATVAGERPYDARCCPQSGAPYISRP